VDSTVPAPSGSQLLLHAYSHSYFADLRAYPPGKWAQQSQGTELKHTRGRLQNQRDRAAARGQMLTRSWPGRAHSSSPSSCPPEGSVSPGGREGVAVGLVLRSMDRTDSHPLRGYAPDRIQAEICQEGGP